MAIRVRAKVYMYYDKRGREAGEEYDMDDREKSEAELLEKIGKIEILRGDQTNKQTVAMTTSSPLDSQQLSDQSSDQQLSDPSSDQKTNPPAAAGIMSTDTAGPIAPAPERRTFRRQRGKA
jgi:hypothetical protein